MVPVAPDLDHCWQKLTASLKGLLKSSCIVFFLLLLFKSTPPPPLYFWISPEDLFLTTGTSFAIFAIYSPTNIWHHIKRQNLIFFTLVTFFLKAALGTFRIFSQTVPNRCCITCSLQIKKVVFLLPRHGQQGTKLWFKPRSPGEDWTEIWPRIGKSVGGLDYCTVWWKYRTAPSWKTTFSEMANGWNSK